MPACRAILGACARVRPPTPCCLPSCPAQPVARVDARRGSGIGCRPPLPWRRGGTHARVSCSGSLQPLQQQSLQPGHSSRALPLSSLCRSLQCSHSHLPDYESRAAGREPAHSLQPVPAPTNPSAHASRRARPLWWRARSSRHARASRRPRLLRRCSRTASPARWTAAARTWTRPLPRPGAEMSRFSPSRPPARARVTAGRGTPAAAPSSSNSTSSSNSSSSSASRIRAGAEAGASVSTKGPGMGRGRGGGWTRRCCPAS